VDLDDYAAAMSSSSTLRPEPEKGCMDTYFPGPKTIRKEDYAMEFVPKSGEDRDESKRVKLPYFLNPFVMQNAAFLMSYFNVGIAMYFLGTPVSYYLITTLDISSTQFSAYNALISIPWSLKFIFGMTSDGVPILRYRRKSWFFIGWMGFVIVNLALAFTGAPGVNMTIGMMFFMTCLYLLADVCTDTMAVERSRFENETIKGSLQTSCYTIRSFGTIIGALMGALLYNTMTWGWGLTINQCFLLSALIPLITIMPTFPPLEELASNSVVPSLTEQLQALWETMQLRAVYQGVGYIYFYGIFQIPNGAWSTFLLEGLHFTDFEYGMLTLIGTILSWIGLNVYKWYFFDTSWRSIYIYTTLLGTVFSLLQIVLILQLNVSAGIPNFYFALGDTAVASLVGSIQFMPSCIMFAMLCPEGSEGLVYAVLTTIMNLSGTVASDIGSAFTLIWDVSNETISNGNYTGVLNLAILTSVLQLFPLCMVWLLPDSKEEQRKLRDSGERSHNAGAILLTVVVLSLVGTIIVSVVLIWY
jgi:MFS family permease